MIAQQVMTENGIVITAADFDRLHGLVESPRYRTTHGTLLRNLKEEFGRGKVVRADRVSKTVVNVRSQVCVHDRSGDERETYTLAYPEEADINAGKLPVMAPLGTAPLETRAGQIVKFDAPTGQRRLKVEKILYQPETAGDLHL